MDAKDQPAVETLKVPTTQIRLYPHHQDGVVDVQLESLAVSQESRKEDF